MGRLLRFSKRGRQWARESKHFVVFPGWHCFPDPVSPLPPPAAAPAAGAPPPVQQQHSTAQLEKGARDETSAARTL